MSNSTLVKTKIQNFVLLVLGLLLTAFLLYQLVFASSTPTLLPLADGTYLQWTPSSGSVHYVKVDESVCNGTTDYNYTTTVGSRDSYSIDLPLPNGSTISKIEIVPCASRHKAGSGSSVMNVFYRMNGADSADAGNYNLSGTTPVELAVTSFDGLSLVRGSSSTLQIGAVYASGTKGVRLSRLAAVLTYTPLYAPTNLTAAFVSPDVVLNWTDNSTNEDGFKVYRGQGGDQSEIGTVGANVTTFTDPAPASGTYGYRVDVFNSGGQFSSNTATTTVP